MTKRSRRLVLTTVAGLSLAGAGAGAARAEETLFVLGDGVPASMDVDGPSGTYPPSQEGMINLIDPLVNYAINPPNADGVQTYDYNSFAPALATSWSFDKATNTWTMKLRTDAKSCAGNTFSADDVLYAFGRAKSVSGQAPIGAFLSSVASLKNFNGKLYGKGPEVAELRKLGDEVTKIDDQTVQFKLDGPNPLFLRVLSVLGLSDLRFQGNEGPRHARRPVEPCLRQHDERTRIRRLVHRKLEEGRGIHRPAQSRLLRPEAVLRPRHLPPGAAELEPDRDPAHRPRPGRGRPEPAGIEQPAHRDRPAGDGRLSEQLALGAAELQGQAVRQHRCCGRRSPTPFPTTTSPRPAISATPGSGTG